MLSYENVIAGIRKGEWSKTPGAPPVKYAALQFTEKSDKPGDEAMKFIEVNLPDGDDGSSYKVGQMVRLQVRVSAKDKKIYYRAEGSAAPTTPPRASVKS